MKKLTEKEITNLMASQGRMEAQFSEVDYNELDKMASETIAGFCKLYPLGGGKMTIDNWTFEEVGDLIYATKKGEKESLPLNLLPDPEKKEIHTILTDIDYTDPKYNPMIPGSSLKFENQPGTDYTDPEQNPMIPDSEGGPCVNAVTTDPPAGPDPGNNGNGKPINYTDPKQNEFIPDHEN